MLRRCQNIFSGPRLKVIDFNFYVYNLRHSCKVVFSLYNLSKIVTSVAIDVFGLSVPHQAWAIWRLIYDPRRRVIGPLFVKVLDWCFFPHRTTFSLKRHIVLVALRFIFLDRIWVLAIGRVIKFGFWLCRTASLWFNVSYEHHKVLYIGRTFSLLHLCIFPIKVENSLRCLLSYGEVSGRHVRLVHLVS